jgi:hypothetical protein
MPKAASREWVRLFALCVLGIAALGFDPFVVPLTAQTLYGSVVGNITDPSSAAVPGAIVTLVNTETGFNRKVTAGDGGAYSVPDLQAGRYDVSIVAPSFANFTQQGVTVSNNVVVRVDVQLQLAGTSQNVTVVGSAAVLQTDRADVHTDLGTKQFQDLPVSGGRVYQSLFKLIPGFTPPRSQNSLVSNGGEDLVAEVNGTTKSTNNTRIDGASNTNVWLPQHSAYVPPLESIESVNVATNSMDAEQGQAGGAAINVTIKSGTNDFHGVGFEYNTDSAIQARNVFYNSSSLPKNIQNQYGGTLGGPIVRNKLFFFVGDEQTSRRANVSRLATVPTAAQRAGDFSGLGTLLYDPLTGNSDGSGRTPFANSIIPASRQSRVAQQLNSWLPDPTTSNLASNYFSSGNSTFDRNSLDSKVNWNKSDKFTMFGRFSIMNFTDFSPTVFDKASGQAIDTSQQAGPGEGRVISTSIGTNYIVSPTFLLDGNVAYTRIAPSTYPIQYGQNIGLDVLKIPGTNGPTVFESGIPEFQVTGYETVGNPGSATPYFWHDNEYQYNANASWMKGNHSFRFGMDISRQDMNHLTAEQGAGPRGTFQFTGGVTALKGGSPNQFNAFAAYLLGLPSTVGKTVPVEAPVTTRAWSQGYYARDQWQATRNLTITLGVRYEFYPIPTRDHRGLERYDVTDNKVLIGGIGDVPMDMGVSVSHLLFYPRIGIAYRPSSKWVVRAGYGMNADPYSLARPFRTNYPVLVDQNFVSANSYAFVGTTENGIPPIPIPSLGNGVIDIPGKVSAKALDTNFRRGYVETFNFTIQRELWAGFSGEAAYVGTRGIRQQVSQELNWAPVGTGNDGRVLNRQFGRVASTLLQAPFGTANYNALQTRISRRFANGFQFQASYTYSKAIAFADEADSTLAFNIPDEFGRNRSATGYDRTHNFEAGWTAELPFGKGKPWAQSGLPRFLLGGWQLNSTFSAYSGTPFTVTASGASLNAPTEMQTADQKLPKVAIPGGTGPSQSYFNPTAFAPVTAIRFGTSGLNTLRGPGLISVDFGLFREFAVKERFRIQFRAEAFNATNTPHFNNPGANVSNALFNSDGTISKLNGYTEISSALPDQRQLRLGLRLSF